MEITLEKIELVKDRTGVTYAEAKKALEEADGSVVDAIIGIEETINSGNRSRGFGEKGASLFESLKALVRKGNVAKIQVKKDDEIILNVPVNAGILGICIAPLASVVAIVAAFGFKCVIEVVKTDGTIIDISDTVTDKMTQAAEYGSDKFDTLKGMAGEYYDKAKNKADEFKEAAGEKADDLKDMAEDNEIVDKAKSAAQDLKTKAEEKADELKDKADEIKAKAEEKADELKDKIIAKDDIVEESDDEEDDIEEVEENEK